MWAAVVVYLHSATCLLWHFQCVSVGKKGLEERLILYFSLLSFLLDVTFPPLFLYHFSL